MTTMKYYVLGGIGDLLQCLPFMLSEKKNKTEFFVMSHQRDSQQLLLDLDINLKKFIYYQTIEDQIKFQSEIIALNQIEECPRSIFFEKNPFLVMPEIFNNKNKVIGIHLGGSDFSIALQKKLQIPSKNLPVKIIHEFQKKDFNLLVFGTKKELDNYQITPSNNIKLMYCDSIYEALAHVAQCHLFVGSDSAFKTLSSMLKIPTYVWLADYFDEFRDNNFISPYVKSGVMDVFRYKNLENIEEFLSAISQTFKFINDTLFPINKRICTALFNSSFGPIIINLKDKGVSGDIISSGYFESKQIELLIQITDYLLGRQKNITIYDVGANLGTHTLALAKISDSRIHIRAFEVQSKVFYMLCGTVALNGLGNVDCHHLAVGNKSNEIITINTPDYSDYCNYGGFEVKDIIKSDNRDIKKPIREKVFSVKLDSFKETVDLMKIDVEGMEEDVLNGAIDIFDKSSTICLIEIFKSDEEKIKSFFRDRKYIGYATKQDLLAIPSNFGLQINGMERIF